MCVSVVWQSAAECRGDGESGRARLRQAAAAAAAAEARRLRLQQILQLHQSFRGLLRPLFNRYTTTHTHNTTHARPRMDELHLSSTIYLWVVVILLLNVMKVFSVGGASLLDRVFIVFKTMCVLCLCSNCASKCSFHVFVWFFILCGWVRACSRDPNDTAYKRWSCHRGYKLLCKLCRNPQPPAMRTHWMAGTSPHEIGWCQDKSRSDKHTHHVWICDICHKQIHFRKQISIRCNMIEHWVHLWSVGIR